MSVAILRETIYGKALLVLLVILASVQLTPYIISDKDFRGALKPLYRCAFGTPARIPCLCTGLDVKADSRLVAEQRLAIGSILRSLGCIDLAVRVLPEFTTTSNRLDLLAYQWGLIAWAQGDTRRAVAMWRQGQGIDRRLLIEARRLRESDLHEAQRWYEAAIMSAGSLPLLAEASTAYSEELRGRVSPEAFRERLSYLVAYFGADTGTGYRLRGQHSLMGGSYRAAFEQLSQAIALGVTDAETWYLLGDAAWKVDDLLTAEQAYRAALDAPIQIGWRKPWHLHRLATLLVSEGRLSEALPFQEEAVRLSDYYSYSDSLAVLLAKLGEKNRALSLCRRARMLAGSTQPPLQCEKP